MKSLNKKRIWRCPLGPPECYHTYILADLICLSRKLKRQDKRLKQPLKMQNGQALLVAVDQSVKIEELSRDSVIGIASREASIAYVVPRRVKRHFNEYFRRIGQPRQCAPSVFAAAIVTSLQAGKWSPSIIIVDTEYSGYEQLIIACITAHFPRAVVSIKRIGRSSPAHAVAYNTHLNHRQPDGILSQRLLHRVIKQQKTAGEPHRPGLTGVRKPNQPVSYQHSKR